MSETKPNSNKPVLLKAVEVSQMTGVSTKTLTYWRINGEGPNFVKLGDSKQSPIRYRLCDVEAWIQSRLRKSTSDKGGAI